jgi:hypothetical protein
MGGVCVCVVGVGVGDCLAAFFRWMGGYCKPASSLKECGSRAWAAFHLFIMGTEDRESLCVCVLAWQCMAVRVHVIRWTCFIRHAVVVFISSTRPPASPPFAAGTGVV